MKRRSRNRRRNHSKLDFQRLEARQLLAGDLIGPHQVAGLLPTGANIVVNGDFETVTEGADRFFTQEEVAGWNAEDAATGQEINIFRYNVPGFDNVLDLDSTTTDFDSVFQELPTEVETEYLITFDYTKHPTFDPNASEFTHDFEVWWNFELVGRFTGGDRWNTGVIKVTSSNLDTTRLLFCEIAEPDALTGDGRGALLDNIRVVKSNPVTINNGGFETTAADINQFYGPNQVDGWSAIAEAVGNRLLKVVDNGTASEGAKYLNLDTTAENRDIAATELSTTSGASYYLTFDVKNDGEQIVNPDELRVRWADQWASTIFATNEWKTYGLFLTATSDTTTLMFLEPGETTGTGSGPLIDNVQMYMVDEVILNLSVDANGQASGVDGAAVYVPGAGAQPIGQDITLKHPTDGNLTSAVLTLDVVVDGANEILSISNASIPVDGSNNPKIVVTTYDSTTNQLVLTGTATVQEYQTLLRTLTYFNAAENVSTTNRVVKIEITDSNLPANNSTAEAAIDLSIETVQTAIDSAIITKFIADNSLDAQHLGNGLYIVIDEPGTGLNPTINSTVRTTYDGKFIELDNQNKLVESASFEISSSQGFTTRLTQVIQGWGLAFPSLKPGGSGKLIIPSDLAYGPNGQGSIPGNTVLVFDVELLEIIS